MKVNKKGFTLIELLAVIVVLAIIMIIAVPSVLSSMNDARRNSFVVYAEKLINSAQAKVQSKAMIGQDFESGQQFDVTYLVDGPVGSYKGFVTYTKNPNGGAYKISLRDNNFFVWDMDYTALESAKSEDVPETWNINTINSVTAFGTGTASQVSASTAPTAANFVCGTGCMKNDSTTTTNA